MTRFVTSAPTERAFMTRPRWQHPGRRRHIHGDLVPMNDNRPSRVWFWTQFAIYAVCTAYALSLWVIR